MLQLNQESRDNVEGIIIPGFSGLLTGVANNADLFAVRNISSRTIVVFNLRLRWMPRTAFTTAQGIGLRVHKVYAFTAIHTGTVVQAHYRNDPAGGVAGDRIPSAEIAAVIATTGALAGGTYTNVVATEPEFVGVGSGSTTPGLYEDWAPNDGVGLSLQANTGLVVKLVGAMGAAGAGSLFVGIDGVRLG